MDEIGYLQDLGTLGFKVACSQPHCQWADRNPDREKAEALLQEHADSLHPPRIPVYRKVKT